MKSDNGPFDRLPREVILHIFRYLNFYTLIQCCQVSKLFYQVATSTISKYMALCICKSKLHDSLLEFVSVITIQRGICEVTIRAKALIQVQVIRVAVIEKFIQSEMAENQDSNE